MDFSYVHIKYFIGYVYHICLQDTIQPSLSLCLLCQAMLLPMPLQPLLLTTRSGFTVSIVHPQPASAPGTLGHVSYLGRQTARRTSASESHCASTGSCGALPSKSIQKILFITAAIRRSALLCIPFIYRGSTKWNDRWWQGHFIHAVSNWHRRQHHPLGSTCLHCSQ